MAAECTSIEIVIEAQNRAAAAIGQAVADQKRFAEELKRAKAAADGSQESNLRLGRAILGQRDAQARLHDEMQRVLSSKRSMVQLQEGLRGALQATTSEISAQAGALGRFAAGLGSVGSAIGLAVGAFVAFGTAAVTAANKIGDY